MGNDKNVSEFKLAQYPYMHTLLGCRLLMKDIILQ